MEQFVPTLADGKNPDVVRSNLKDIRQALLDVLNNDADPTVQRHELEQELVKVSRQLMLIDTDTYDPQPRTL